MSPKDVRLSLSKRLFPCVVLDSRKAVQKPSGRRFVKQTDWL
jgi:hypothetical protein